MESTKTHVTNMGPSRMEMLEKHMDDNGRDTSERSMKYHKTAFKAFVNNLPEFDKKKFEDYVKEYCEEDDHFEVEIPDNKPEKPKRVLTAEHLAKMQEGRRKKAEAKKASAAAEKAEDSVEETVEEKVVEKPKARKSKAAPAH